MKKYIFIILLIFLNLSPIIFGQNYLEFYKNKRVLVSGGAGFIGSNIAQTLVNAGAQVTILDDLSTGSLNNIKEFADKIIFIKDSIANFEACLNATKNISIVFHLAAMISVPESIEKPDFCNKINIMGTANLLQACKQNNVESFVFSSSSAVYGKKDGICSETLSCLPESPYGYSKLIGELLCKEYSQFYGLNTVILRYFNVYGNRQNPNGAYAAVVAKFKNQMRNNLPITIFGDGLQTRDFIEDKKVVEANLKLGYLAKNISGETFNIATGKSINLLELIDILKKEFPNYNQKVIFAPERLGDIKFSQADCTKYFNVIKNLN